MALLIQAAKLPEHDESWFWEIAKGRDLKYAS